MGNDKKNSFTHIWAPWRMEYIRMPEEDKPKGCIFCEKPKNDEDKDDLILYRSKNVFVIMNRYPYNNGHLMVVPYRHISDYNLLSKEELHEISDVTQIVIKVLKEIMKPQGFNVGFNIGESAGAGIAEHIHQHIVPRWIGDTNFMPVLCHTKVMVDGLNECWLELKKAFDTYK
ncbi:MAG: HIT domain-containing protein [Candidatus Marinimicrobia bacterium]|nr:HIT domain-containing protein [Candidatus Neomarinimicrobiota bacterium]